MPRVCHLITRLIRGGAQRIALETALHARERGWEVELWCGPQAGPEGTLAPEARERGIEPRLFPALRRELAPVQDLAALVALRRALGAGRFDLVHTHSSKAGILGRAAAAGAGVPHRVHSVHGWAMTPATPPWVAETYVRLERRAARQAHALIAVSEAVRDAGLARGIGRPEQYRVIHGGVRLPEPPSPSARARARAELGLPREAFVLGTVGRLDDAKDPLGAFAALAPGLAADPRLHLAFVGDGHLRPRLERAIAAAGLGSRVTLAGLRADAASLCPAFDLFFLASRWEGFPLAVIEALAAGVPVVAYDVAGVREAVREGFNGHLVAAGDERAWSERLLALAGAPDRRAELAARARESVAERFDQDRMLAETLALYGEILAGQGAPEPDARG